MEGYNSVSKTGQDEGLAYMIGRDIDSTIQPPLKDISYSLAQKLAEQVHNRSENEQFPTRKEAVEYFDKRFMQRELTRVKGNITQYVRDAFGTTDEKDLNNLRRNVYRKIEKHGLHDLVDRARPWKQSGERSDGLESITYPAAENIERTLTGALSGYKEVIQPQVYDSVRTRIKESSGVLAEKISGYAPTQANRLNRLMESTQGITRYMEAKDVFERKVVYDALQAARWDKKKAAGYLGDSLRTLNRKITQLGIQQSCEEQEGKKDDADSMEKIMHEHGKDEEKRQEGAVSEAERFRQLVQQYNRKREEERKRRERLAKDDKVLKKAA